MYAIYKPIFVLNPLPTFDGGLPLMTLGFMNGCSVWSSGHCDTPHSGYAVEEIKRKQFICLSMRSMVPLQIKIYGVPKVLNTFLFFHYTFLLNHTYVLICIKNTVLSLKFHSLYHFKGKIISFNAI